MFAGVELKGVSISTDGGEMRHVYGDGVNAREVLVEGRRTAPEAVQEFPRELARFSRTREESGKATDRPVRNW